MEKKGPKVVRLSDITGDCFQISPDQAIYDFRKFLSENQEFDKVFLIAINTKNDGFQYTWFKGKMKCSEAIAALNLSLSDQTHLLCYPGNPEDDDGEI